MDGSGSGETGFGFFDWPPPNLSKKKWNSLSTRNDFGSTMLGVVRHDGHDKDTSARLFYAAATTATRSVCVLSEQHEESSSVFAILLSARHQKKTRSKHIEPGGGRSKRGVTTGNIRHDD
jgi:hypothetical protein